MADCISNCERAVAGIFWAYCLPVAGGVRRVGGVGRGQDDIRVERVARLYKHHKRRMSAMPLVHWTKDLMDKDSKVKASQPPWNSDRK